MVLVGIYFAGLHITMNKHWTIIFESDELQGSPPDVPPDVPPEVEAKLVQSNEIDEDNTNYLDYEVSIEVIYYIVHPAF